MEREHILHVLESLRCVTSLFLPSRESRRIFLHMCVRFGVEWMCGTVQLLRAV